MLGIRTHGCRMAGADGSTVLWRLSFKQQFLRIIVDFSEIVTLNVGKEGKHADKLAQEITFQDPVYLIFIACDTMIFWHEFKIFYLFVSSHSFQITFYRISFSWLQQDLNSNPKSMRHNTLIIWPSQWPWFWMFEGQLFQQLIYVSETTNLCRLTFW